MPDNRRVDLSNDLDSLLQDVKAATEEVRLQQQKNKQKEAQAAIKEKSRTQSTWMIITATVVLLVVAYFVVFAGSNNDASSSATAPVKSTPHVSVDVRSNNRSNGINPRTLPTPPVTRNVQPVNTPPNDYEQPRGM